MANPRAGHYTPLNPLGMHSENRYRNNNYSMGAETEVFEGWIGTGLKGGGKLLGKGGKGILSVNGKEVANARIDKTQPNIFSADETADVGLDNQTPVALGIGYGPEETTFTGKINKVVVSVK